MLSKVCPFSLQCKLQSILFSCVLQQNARLTTPNPAKPGVGQSLLLIFACPRFCRLLVSPCQHTRVTAFQPLPQLLTSAGRNSSVMARGLDIYKWCLFFWNSICSQLHVLFIRKSCDLNTLKPLSCVSCSS